MSGTTESFASEYEALTVGCGCAWLVDWTTVAVAGSDRQSFLHNMCSNDIRRLEPGDGCEAFCTDVKGKIVAHVFVIAQQDQLELLTVPNQAETLCAHLERYIIREDVQLEDQTQQRSWLLCSGTQTAEAVAGLIPEKHDKLHSAWQNKVFEFEGRPGLVVRCPLFWPEGFLLRCETEEQATLSEFLHQRNSAMCEVVSNSNAGDALAAVRIESEFPWFGVDFTAANFPQEVNRDSQAINFNKGCYLGQETIARIDALGHVNQKVVSLLFAGDATPPKDLELRLGDKHVGRVTSACWSPRAQRPLALALVRRGANDLGTELESDLGPAAVVAMVGRSD